MVGNMIFIIVFSLFTCILLFADFKHVTCGSVLKLRNIRQNVRLHSHDVKYGSGSGQQVSDNILC